MYDDAPAPRPERRRRDSDLIDERPRSYARENRGKELFSGRKSQRDRSASPARDGDGDDLMGERASSSNNRNRARALKDRRSADNSAKELFPVKSSIKQFGGGNLDHLEAAIGSAGLREEDRPKIVSVPNTKSSSAFNIRGMASQQGSSEGFSIKGAAGANARELFPSKLGGSNAGKELFGGGGRSKQRQKAEDLFS